MTFSTSKTFSFAGIFAPFTQAEAILSSPKGWQNYRNYCNTNRKTKDVVQICLVRGQPRVVSSLEFTAHLGSHCSSLLFITHRRKWGQKPWLSPFPRNSQSKSSVQGDDILWMSWQPQEKTGRPASGVRLRGMNGVLQELGVQGDAIFQFWVLAAPDWQTGRAPKMSFLYWYLELGMAFPIETMLIGGGLVPRLVK